MITADLDRELAASVAALVADSKLPAAAAHLIRAGTWRPAPDGNPASYATAVTFEVARLGSGAPAELAAALAEPLRAISWIEAAGPSGEGYLTITVTPQALAGSAARMVMAGLACADSSILGSATATVPPWPDLAAAVSWRHAWQGQADAMIGRLARTAGATVTVLSGRERVGTGDRNAGRLRSSVPAAVAYFGLDSVRYRLARTLPGQAEHLALQARAALQAWPGVRGADPLYPVQQAHVSAVSTLRWAREVRLHTRGSAEWAGGLLGHPAERSLLGLLTFLPVRVAAAARRRRPDELPRYLEQVGAGWLACQLACPALPFGGQAAPGDTAVASARLMLAEAAAIVLATGLALTGIVARDRL